MISFKRLRSVAWATVFSEFSAIMVKLALISLFLFLIFVVFRGLNQEGYRLQSFQVPKELNEAGFNGQVVALMLQDHVVELKEIANSQRVDSLNLSVDLKPDLNLDVMGVGLSSTSMIFHLRELLGRETFSISGNVTDLQDQLTLKIRMTGYPNFQVDVPYTDGNIKDALEEAIDKGAMHVLGNIDPYRLAIVHYRRDNDTEKAEEVIRDIIRNRPADRKWAYHFWGNIKQQADEVDKAKRFYNKALEEDATFVLPMMALGWQYFREKDYPAALESFEKILANAPMHQSAHNGSALCHRELGDMDKAEEHYKLQLEKHPDVIWSYGNYSDFLMRFRKDTAATVHLWKTASENIEESAEYYVSLAAFELMQGDSAKAMTYGLQALDLDPNNVSVLSQFSSYYYYMIKDYENAQIFYKRLAKAVDNQNYDIGMRSSAWNMLAMSDYQVGDFDSSYVHVQKAISIIPENPYPYSTLAELNILRGDERGFYKAIEEAIKRGFRLEDFLKEHPYNLIKDQSRMLELIEKYKNGQELKG